MLMRYDKHEIIEVIKPANVTSAGSRINFTDQPQLRTIINDATVYIKRIDVYPDYVIPFSPITAGTAVADGTALANATLTLNVAGYEWIHLLPLLRMNPFVSDTVALVPYINEDPFFLADLYRVDWTKSYVQFVGAPPNTAISYLFGVYYDYEPGLGVKPAANQRNYAGQPVGPLRR